MVIGTHGRLVRQLLALIALYALTFSCFGMSGGGGTVLNASTGESIGDATVRLECRGAQLHGSSVLKTLETRAGRDGSFSFSFLDVWRCSHAYVSAQKDGFVITTELLLHYQNDGQFTDIPKKVFMIPADHADLYRIWSRSLLNWGAGSLTSPEKSYRGYYTGFMRSRALALSPSQTEYVKKTYCGKLMKAYGDLSQQQQESVKKSYWGDERQLHDMPRQFDHETQVGAFCAAR